MKRDINVWSLFFTKTKALANLPRRLLQRRQPAARWRLATSVSHYAGATTNTTKRWNALLGCRKHLACVLHRSVKVKHTFQRMYYFVGYTMLQWSVPYLGEFPPYGRNSWTLRHYSAEMSRPMVRTVSALGPKCLDAEVSGHFGTSTELF